MPLSNPKHERFAQAVATGQTIERAYVAAGFKPDLKNAHRLSRRPDVASRIDAILTVSAQATGLTVQRIVDELSAIAFVDVTEAVEWGDALSVKTVNGDDRIVQGVALKASKDIPERVRRAISEVRQTKDGVAIKFHSKVVALERLGQHLRMFDERLDAKLTITLEDLVMRSYAVAAQRAKVINQQGEDVSAD